MRQFFSSIVLSYNDLSAFSHHWYVFSYNKEVLSKIRKCHLGQNVFSKPQGVHQKPMWTKLSLFKMSPDKTRVWHFKTSDHKCLNILKYILTFKSCHIGLKNQFSPLGRNFIICFVMIIVVVLVYIVIICCLSSSVCLYVFIKGGTGTEV